MNDQRRSGNVKTKLHQSPNRLWNDGISCQQFFRVGKWKRYFVVRSNPDTLSVEKVDDLVRRGEEMLAAQLREVVDYRTKKRVEADENRYEANAWLDRAGWAKHLVVYDRSDLPQLIEFPRREGVEAESNVGDNQERSDEREDEA